MKQARRDTRTQRCLGPAGHLFFLVLLPLALLSVGCGESDSPQEAAADGVLPNPDEVITLDGLKEPVHVLIDVYGIPHIYGSSDEDVLAAQGYMHARDRFVEIDLYRHASSGRVAELTGQMPVIGPLLGDLTARTIDWLLRSIFTTHDGQRIADQILADASPDVLKTMQSFRTGVNAYIRDLREGRNGAELPSYYKDLMGVREDNIPEYSPEDVVYLGLFMAFFLAGMDDLVEDLTHAAYFQYVDEDILFDTLRSAPADPTSVLPYPWDPGNQVQDDRQASLVPQTGQKTASPSRMSESSKGSSLRKRQPNPAPEIPEETLSRARYLFRLIASLMGHPEQIQRFGSNNWTVSPSSTRRGYAILSNDQHLALMNPPIYYQSHLNTKRFGGGDLNVIGVSFAGFPGISSGHNEFLAWGQTVMGYDQADIYVETVPDEEDGFPASVLFQGEPVPTQTAWESFRVGYGPGSTEIQLPIVYTPHHGPVLPFSTRKGTALSMKWAGQVPFKDSEGLVLIDRAKDVFEFAEALTNFHAAAFHWVFADVHGNIGYSGHARIPVRRNIRQYPPHRPLPGTGEAEWDGFVSEADLPLAFNSEDGFFNTSNNDIFGTTVDNDPFNDPVYYFFNADIGFRARRVRTLLRERIQGNGVSFEDMMDIQGDTLSFAAARLLPFLFQAEEAMPELVPTALQKALERLRGWDYTSPTGTDAPWRATPPDEEEIRQSAASSIFHAWLNRMLHDTFRDDYRAYRQQEPPDVEMTTKALIHLLEHPEESRTGEALFDDRATEDHVETPHEIMLRSLSRAINFLRDFFGTSDMDHWRWGELHQVRFLLGYEDISLPLFPIQGPFPKSGANFTVDASDFGSHPDSFNTTFGASTRFVIELEPGVLRGVNAQPGGQSEWPEDSHYGDLSERWLDNRYHELYFWFEDVLAHTESYVEFVP